MSCARKRIMSSLLCHFSCLAGLLLLSSGCGRAQVAPAAIASVNAGRQATAGGVVPVVVSHDANGAVHLLRGGQPYFVKGAGGSGDVDLLKASGANSLRTWGADEAPGYLAAAQKRGMTVTVGIWLGHKDQGFDYHNAAQVAAQKESARAAIERLKNSPALLVWAIGNEMESGQGDDDPAVWNAIEDIAALAKKIDPNHPTMTVVAEIGGAKVRNFQKYCPDVDILGINSYGGAPSIAARYRAAGGVKPYMLTEFGPAGTWETGKNAWGAAIEPTSTQKAATYRAVYEKAVLGQPLCLGSYAFTWGFKQEATATWFGLLLPNGSRLGGVDALEEMWTGHAPANRCPVIGGLEFAGSAKIAPGASLPAHLDARDPDGDPIRVDWVVQADPSAHGTGGATEATPPVFADAVHNATTSSATVEAPRYGGAYRLFAYVYDNHNGAAVANAPFFVTGDSELPPPPVRKASLPLVLYGADAKGAAPYVPAGFMGNTSAIHLDPNSTDSPRAGKTCLKIEYTASDNWGGVVWQSPAGDWGDVPGGWNLTGAKKLTFWARGSKGGEKIGFLFGLIDRNKEFYDTAMGKLEGVALTTDWKQYTIPLQHKDLSRIKTGFAWSAAANGQPFTFYLDDIRYE
jgi:hypothetical protein